MTDSINFNNNDNHKVLPKETCLQPRQFGINQTRSGGRVIIFQLLPVPEKALSLIICCDVI